jgi:hypothetical protein|tara:strand:- start:5381 stop:5632 length:252 start_codon:yes stop_codon:yes gene_type:complete
MNDNKYQVSLPLEDAIKEGALAYEHQMRLQEQQAANDRILAGQAKLSDTYVPVKDLASRFKDAPRVLTQDEIDEAFIKFRNRT